MRIYFVFHVYSDDACDELRNNYRISIGIQLEY